MITYEKFKKLYNSLEQDRNIEIGVYFKNNIGDYLIVKFGNYLTIGRFDCDKNKILEFNDIDELYNATVENICFRNDWSKIDDILIDLTFSVVNDQEEISKVYGVCL